MIFQFYRLFAPKATRINDDEIISIEQSSFWNQINAAVKRNR